MKALILSLMLAAVLGAATISRAASDAIDSIYTSLTAKDCKTLEYSEDEAGWYKGRCLGTAGYRLDLMEGDIRQTLTVIDPDGKAFPLDLWSTVSGGFSALGDKAEWRVKTSGGKTTPFALIVRYNVNEDPERPEKVTSYLVVSKITATDICVTDVVGPIRNANERARVLADEAADRACKAAP
jgi:hypothetical protein